MKRQIRRGAFETNSSSTHAICISKKRNYKIPAYVTFTHDEFGWEFGEYNDTWTKASYLYQAIISVYYDDPEPALKKLKSILADYGVACEFEPARSGEFWDNGYIDHGGECYEFVEAVLNDNELLFTYLFGDSFVITGNDNGYSFDERMYVKEEDIVESWGTYPSYGDLKPEFRNYDIYRKGN